MTTVKSAQLKSIQSRQGMIFLGIPRPLLGAAVLACAPLSVAFAADELPPAPAPAAAPTGDAPLEEIVVTGTYLKHTIGQGSAVRTLDLSKTEPTATLGELFLAQPEFNGNAVFSDPGGNSQTGASFLNLRGLGPSATLVLLNGRRQTVNAQPDTKGRYGVDVEALTPQIMLERVEVVKDGASAIYGTDAVAGVVNFITRKNFTGAEVETNYQRTETGNENQYTASALFGGGSDDTHFVLGAEYVRRDPLNYYDYSPVVNYIQRPGALTLSPYGVPGTYRLIPGQTYNSLVGPGSPTRTVADPLCGDPRLGGGGAAGFLTTSGVNQSCTSNTQLGRSIIGGEDRITVLATANRQYNDYFNLDGQIGFTRKNLFRDGAYGLNVAFAPTVPASNPGNPFGGAVTFAGRVPGAPSGDPIQSITKDITYTGALTASGKLPVGFLENQGWTWEAEVNWSENHSDAYQNDTVKVDLQNALNGLGGPNCNPATGTPGVGNCMYYNPFGNAFLAAPGSAQANSQALLNWLLPAQDRATDATLLTYHALARGDLFDLPAGAVGLAVGYEGRRERLTSSVDPTTIDGGWSFITQEFPFSASRTYNAGFFELRVPVLHQLELQGAGRYEAYQGQSSFNPKIGFTAAPVSWLDLRGSYGKSFQAPTLQAVYGTGSSSANGINWPGINAVSTKAVIAPNPDLEPQTSKSYTGGFDLKPVERLTLGADYYYIDFSGLVGQEAPQLLINQYLATGANADRFVFDPTGKTLITIYLHNINASSVKTDGWDFTANYYIPTGFGRFTVNGAATYTHRYDYQQSAGGVILNGVGGSNQGTSIPALPKWKGNLNLSWRLGGHEVMAATQYISGLTNPAFALTSPLQDTASYVREDLFYSYSWSQVTVRAGVQNLFDRLPPFQAGQQFYPLFAGVYDPRGRMYNLDLKVSF